MNNSKDNLSGEESLQIIQEMIRSAKQEQKDNGMGWIVWGWMLFLASALTVINIHLNLVKTYFFWNTFGIATIVMLVLSTIRKNQKKISRVTTYTKEVFNKLNIGFTITLLVIIVAINVSIGPISGFALLTALYGFWVLIYGALFNFKPSIIASYFVWALALAGLFVQTFEWVMIFHGLAVLVGYIIPGHIAYNEFNKSVGRNTKSNIGV
ncbi:MAG: hypothetical protein LH478_12945 [Chitinophagaceae bacterium]|nr:hypothetical protein [Chitinophagaceae bacterium]